MKNMNAAINWHTAFYEALKAELIDYSGCLEYLEETPLTTEPLRIDLIVVKKRSDITIDKNIAKSFRKYNILEYKPPKKSFIIGDYHKVTAYVNLYMYLYGLTASDVTLTIAITRHPRNLIKYFNQQGLKLTQKSPGVHELESNLFPVQIIETSKLPETDNIWLKNLRNGVNAKKIEEIIEIKTSKYKELRLAAYLYALLAANPESVKEMGVNNMSGSTLAQVLEESGITQLWEARGETRGEARGEARGELKGINGMLYVIKGIKNNIPISQLADETNIPVEIIEKTKSELGKA